MTRQPFYDHVTPRLFYGSLPKWQKEPLDQLIDEGERRNRRVEDIAYVLATAYHETGRFKYDEEIGKGEGHPYGERIWLARNTPVTYHGRGFVQQTWLSNYAKMSIDLSLEFRTEIDLVNKPEIAATPEIASLIIWMGMIKGSFTGKNLRDYINDAGVDYVEARRIVNGLDKATQIAGYAQEFEAGLRLMTGEAPKSACPLNRADCPKTQEAKP